MSGMLFVKIFSSCVIYPSSARQLTGPEICVLACYNDCNIRFLVWGFSGHAVFLNRPRSSFLQYKEASINKL